MKTRFRLLFLFCLVLTTSGCGDFVEDFLSAREEATTDNPSSPEEVIDATATADLQALNGSSRASGTNSSALLKTQTSGWGVQSGQHSIRLSVSKQGAN